MKFRVYHLICALTTVVIMAAFAVSCANMASPNGGPYDEKPPVLLSSTPQLLQTNYVGKKIELTFDEIIQIEKPSENVIVTPPQKSLPVIRTAGKKIVIELQDTLQNDVTYTIDFTSSVSDNNEKNPIENFSFAFSTGNEIDSMAVSGTVLNAMDLEPMPGILVGLHKNLEDTAFTTTAFTRTSKTNDKGQFTIRNVAEGTYRIYALNDANRDYKFDQPGEDIAFYDSIIIPSFVPATRQDTIWKDSLTVDTIMVVDYNRFLPDSIVLRLFKEKFQRQYMLRPERTQQNLFTLKFNAPLDTLPVIELIDNPPSEEWYFQQIPDDPVSVNYWIKDSLIYQRDTLHLSITYLRTDSLMQLELKTDTVHLAARRQSATSQRRTRAKDDQPPPIEFLTPTFSISGVAEVYDTLSITFPEPILDLSKDIFTLELQEDTLWNQVEFNFVQDSVNVLRYYFERSWKYNEKYRLTVDSAQIYSIYGKWNDKIQSSFGFKSDDAYGHLFLEISDISSPAFVELLDANDAPLRKATVKDGGALFINLLPNKYYARLIVDTNENGKWDTGNYADKLHPEEVYYSPVFYEIRANWKVDEPWNVLSRSLIKQKPMDITKNKPKDVTRPKRNYKEESKTPSRSSGGMGGMGGMGGLRGLGGF